MTTTPIFQFGTSRFLQAHADLFISEAMKTGLALGPVTIVKTSGAADRDLRLAGLQAEKGFPVHVRGLHNGKVVDEVTMVTSVKRALSTAANWAEVVRIFVEEAKVVISNTADRGFDLDSTETHLPKGPPKSFPGKLLVLLRARFEANGNGLTVLPTELISRNGSTLAAIIRELADAWYQDAAFSGWIKQNVIYVNTLVDRIVSKALEPAGAVCEPYALWAIEKTEGMALPCRHPAILVADDISVHANLKLFILNLGHTALVQYWLDHQGSADLTVRQILEDGAARAWLEAVFSDEVMPGFAAMGLSEEAERYARTTIERFSNPFLDHYLSDISQNHSEKISRRIGGFLAWSGNADAPVLSRIRGLVS